MKCWVVTLQPLYFILIQHLVNLSFSPSVLQLRTALGESKSSLYAILDAKTSKSLKLVSHSACFDIL